jgi:hypothetical protein
MEKIDTLAAAAAALSGALAAVTPTEEVRLLAFCTIGAIAGGFVGASISTEPTKGEADRRSSVARRWAVNFAAGIFLGPILTEYLIGKFPDFSRTYVSIFSGGACGVAAVTLICLLFPLILSRLKSTMSKLP